MQCTHTIYIGGGCVCKGRGGGRRTLFKATDDRCSVHTLDAGLGKMEQIMLSVLHCIPHTHFFRSVHYRTPSSVVLWSFNYPLIRQPY